MAEESRDPDAPPRRVVGIGSSAGGLAALEELFRGVSAGSGISYVVVSHLSPDHESALPELLARCTEMPIARIEDGMRMVADMIYVAPGYPLSLAGRTFILSHGSKGLVPRLIDTFFESLAASQKERAVGVVLSGSGSDGAAGAAAIQAAGGLIIAQEPGSAEYESMPLAAIIQGHADLVLHPKDMPGKLLEYLAEDPRKRARAAEPEPTELAALTKILAVIRDSMGHDFSSYKASTILRRIERRKNLHRIADTSLYLKYLRETPQEARALFYEILINVTSFFREPDAFAALGALVEEALRKKPAESVFRAWVAGCSTGEEAFSVAITVLEALDRIGKRMDVQIFASDLDSDAIGLARRARYPAAAAEQINPERLARFFEKDGEELRPSAQVRRSVIFAPHNVLTDPPFTRLDLITCRNMLIYLGPDLQQHVTKLFHYALLPRGVLFLGSSENIGQREDLFTPLDKRWKLYRRVDGPSDISAANAKSGTRRWVVAARTDEEISAGTVMTPLTRTIEAWLLKECVPASAIVDARGEIAYLHQRTGRYLEPAPGEPSHNLFSMAREGLQTALTALLRRASECEGEVALSGVNVKSNGGHISVDLAARRIDRPEALKGLFIVKFTPVSESDAQPREDRAAPLEEGDQAVPNELESELRWAKDHLQTTIEELEASNEELKSANEELQSVNEELETSKEETQSLNEELQTVNSELERKITEVSQSSDDLSNLLNSTDIPTVFLDEKLCVRRYTKQARKVVNLIPSDVGRPLADLVSNLQDDILERARSVLEEHCTLQAEVKAKDGTLYLMRQTPYRAADGAPRGLVLTFIDISELRAATNAAAAAAFATDIVATLRQPLLILDGTLRVMFANRAFFRDFGMSGVRVNSLPFYALGRGLFDAPELKELLERILPFQTTIEDFEVERVLPGLGSKRILINARRLDRESGQAVIFMALELQDNTHS